jgi:NAD(P)-dependent dehydrogenase (short-subunit alcohol dehydrogenase family)
MSLSSLATTWHHDSYPAIDPRNPDLSMAGRKVIITGASTGIGREVAKAFAIAGAASITLLARRAELLLETQELVGTTNPAAQVTTHSVDLTDHAAVEQVAQSVGSWDVLVLNAGYMAQPSLLIDSNTDDWWHTFEVNIKGTYNALHAFLPQRQTNAVVIGTGTALLLFDMSMQVTQSSYVASKLAMMRLLEVAAAEYQDVHFVTYSPGVGMPDTTYRKVR